jgi:hypothetical protein
MRRAAVMCRRQPFIPAKAKGIEHEESSRSTAINGNVSTIEGDGLPLALSLVLAACGGGSDNTPAAEQRTASAMKRMGGASASEPEVALTPVAATSSGSERGDLSAAAAIDHNTATRWGSLFSDDQYLTLDFGASKPINRVHIEWENAHALQYLLQVSDDNATWTTIKTVDNSQGGIEDWTGLAHKAATCA